MNRRQEDGEKAGRRTEGRRTERRLDDEQKAGGRREGWKTNRRQEDGEKAGDRNTYCICILWVQRERES
jgi:hypothetical protein